MDVLPLISALQDGGPTAIYLFFIAVVWWQGRKIAELNRTIDKLQDDFTSFKISCAQSSVTKADIDKLEEAINDGMKDNVRLIEKLFDRMDDLNRNGCARLSVCAK